MPDGVAAGRVDASPEKRFFVDMLTRDIELAPAIIDLVDNSIDGAKRLRPDEEDESRFAGLSVKMRLDAETFEISDTCGGFSRKHAETYAFKFGRHQNQESTPGEVGQFGVGMKRALFKLGREFAVSSRTNGDAWRVEVDVDWWVDEADPDDWSFPLEDADGDLDGPGTVLQCRKLLPSSTARLGQPAFVSRVLREIAMRHALALQQGLAIEVNERALQPRPPVLLASDTLKPISYSETLIDAEGREVEMGIAAGLAASEDGDEEKDTDDPELFTGLDAAGWYVFCNGRALLFADRSRLTGWAEDAVPRFHPQFRSFRGYVHLSGDSAAMPWNTSKTDVDEDSEIWEQTRKHIVDALRKTVKVMNRVKREVQQRPPEDRPLVAAVKNSRPAALERLDERRTFELPPPPPKIVADAKRISYSVSSDAFEKASEAMETDRPSEIGQRSFAYWMRREVDSSYGD